MDPMAMTVQREAGGGAESGMMDSMQTMHGMMSECPCMQMGQMMGSAGGWVMMIVMGALAITAIVALVALSVFLIRRSRVAVAA